MSRGNPLDSSRINSILATSQSHTRPAERLSTLPVNALVSGAQQPRRAFEAESLQSLAQSIREKGVLQPLIVRPLATGGYEIVAGERRWRAAQLADIQEVPVIIRTFTDQEAATVALIENLQREDLNTIDEIDGKLRLVASVLGLAVEQVPGRLNELRRKPVPSEVEALTALFKPLGETWDSFARNKLRVLNYSSHLVDALRRGLSLRLVTLIARAPEEHQQRLIEQAESGTGFKDIQAEVDRLRQPTITNRTKQIGKFLASSRVDRLPASLRTQVQQWLDQMPEGLAEHLQDG